MMNMIAKAKQADFSDTAPFGSKQTSEHITSSSKFSLTHAYIRSNLLTNGRTQNMLTITNTYKNIRLRIYINPKSIQTTKIVIKARRRNARSEAKFRAVKLSFLTSKCQDYSFFEFIKSDPEFITYKIKIGQAKAKPKKTRETAKEVSDRSEDLIVRQLVKTM